MTFFVLKKKIGSLFHEYTVSRRFEVYILISDIREGHLVGDDSVTKNIRYAKCTLLALGSMMIKHMHAPQKVIVLSWAKDVLYIQCSVYLIGSRYFLIALCFAMLLKATFREDHLRKSIDRQIMYGDRISPKMRSTHHSTAIF